MTAGQLCGFAERDGLTCLLGSGSGRCRSGPLYLSVARGFASRDFQPGRVRLQGGKAFSAWMIACMLSVVQSLLFPLAPSEDSPEFFNV